MVTACRSGVNRGLAELFFLFLHAHNRNLGEAFREGWRLQLGGHAAHDVFGNDAIAALMTFEADFQRNIEKHGVDFVVVIFGEFDPVLAFLRGEVRGVHVIHRTLGDEACLEHGAQVGKHEILKALLANVVK